MAMTIYERYAGLTMRICRVCYQSEWKSHDPTCRFAIWPYKAKLRRGLDFLHYADDPGGSIRLKGTDDQGRPFDVAFSDADLRRFDEAVSWSRRRIEGAGEIGTPFGGMPVQPRTRKILRRRAAPKFTRVRSGAGA